ncbi:MAG: dTDP-4-dehydrorhamnose reductase [Bacteroidales bacterium]|nr:dTDP-4-dehydrorhamnose reductase [Bacteroidales bacterium]
MIKILVTGSNGQLGNSIKDLSSEYSNYKFTYTDIEELDIANIRELEDFFLDKGFKFVINCAAYTAVDKAEEESEKALLINSHAVKNLAETCSKNNAILVHISTDYVFNGKNFSPYNESDETCPASSYGRSKLSGEKEIIKAGIKSIIIRTSWLYSEFGHNFVKTMLKYGRERESLNVICDQVGTPTYSRDLAKSILEIVSQTDDIKKPEIFNYSNEGAISWYDFAKAVMEISGIACNIMPIETSDYPLPAPRPPYSVLNKTKIKKRFNIEIPYWKDSLRECIQLLD